MSCLESSAVVSERSEGGLGEGLQQRDSRMRRGLAAARHATKLICAENEIDIEGACGEMRDVIVRGAERSEGESRREYEWKESSEAEIEVAASIVSVANEYVQVLDKILESGKLDWMRSVEGIERGLGEEFVRAKMKFLRGIPSATRCGNGFEVVGARKWLGGLVCRVPLSQRKEVGYGEIMLSYGRVLLCCTRMELISKMNKREVIEDAMEMVLGALEIFSRKYENGARELKYGYAMGFVTVGDILMERKQWREAKKKYLKGGDLLSGERREICKYKSFLASEMMRGMDVARKIEDLKYSGCESMFSI